MAVDFSIHTTFNSLTETSMRLLVVLERFYGTPIKLEELRLLDFFSVFSGDVDGPKSAHFPHGNRAGAYRIREPLIEDALEFLGRAGLVEIYTNLIQAINPCDPETPYRSAYLQDVDTAAAWMHAICLSEGKRRLIDRLNTVIHQLMEESLSASLPEEETDRYLQMRNSHAADYERLIGLSDACELFINYLNHDHVAAANDNGSTLPSFGFFEKVSEAAQRDADRCLSIISNLDILLRDDTDMAIAVI